MFSSPNSGTTRPENGNREKLLAVLRIVFITAAAYEAESVAMYSAIPQGLPLLAATTLLGNPFAKPPLYFFVTYRPLRISYLETLANLFNDIQVILNVLYRAIVWQLA